MEKTVMAIPGWSSMTPQSSHSSIQSLKKSVLVVRIIHLKGIKAHGVTSWVGITVMIQMRTCFIMKEITKPNSN